jgi:hypothetical protein
MPSIQLLRKLDKNTDFEFKVRDYYVNHGLNVEEVARQIGCVKSTVHNRLIKLYGKNYQAVRGFKKNESRLDGMIRSTSKSVQLGTLDSLTEDLNNGVIANLEPNKKGILCRDLGVTSGISEQHQALRDSNLNINVSIRDVSDEDRELLRMARAKLITPQDVVVEGVQEVQASSDGL